MVGALNVGRIKCNEIFNFNLISNNFQRQFKGTKFEKFQPKEKISISAGTELGTFMLGSTVIVVMDASFDNKIESIQSLISKPILLGQKF